MLFFMVQYEVNRFEKKNWSFKQEENQAAP